MSATDSHRRSQGVRVFVALTLAVGLTVILWPLQGAAPQRCTYTGDSGSCETLFYRSIATLTVAQLTWGGSDVTIRKVDPASNQ